jgi:hypothetical protein
MEESTFPQTEDVLMSLRQGVRVVVFLSLLERKTLSMFLEADHYRGVEKIWLTTAVERLAVKLLEFLNTDTYAGFWNVRSSSVGVDMITTNWQYLVSR